MNDSDPIDALRAAWRGLEPGAADAARDSLDELAVERLRSAWRGLAAPAPSIPLPPRRTWRWVAAAVAAAGLLTWALAGIRRPPVAPEPAPSPAPDTVAQRAPHAEFRTPPLSALSNSSMELRSGNVRLLLFLPTNRVPLENETSPKDER